MTRAALTRKPAVSRCARMCPAFPEAKASGLMMVSVVEPGIIEMIELNASPIEGHSVGGRRLGDAFLHESHQIHGARCNSDAGRLDRRNLLFGRAGRTTDDRARVTHAASRRCRAPRDET